MELPELQVGHVKSAATLGISMEHWWQKNLCSTSAILLLGSPAALQWIIITWSRYLSNNLLLYQVVILKYLY